MTEQQLRTFPTITPGTYAIDPTATVVSLVGWHLWGVKPVAARVDVVDGTIRVGADLAESEVSVRLDPATFRSDDKRRDHDVTSKFFHAPAYPEIIFAASRAALADGRWSLPGTLTVKDVSAPVSLDLEVGEQSDGRLQIRATTRLDRIAHGVTAGRGIVNRWVDLVLDVVAVATPPR